MSEVIREAANDEVANSTRTRYRHRRLAARRPELPGCGSADMTEDEALDGIREAIELYLQPDPTELAAGTITREITV
jgi:hypothetical protein